MGKNETGGVTIITPTIRPEFIDQVFQNYAHQKWSKKELIIVINKNNVNINLYKNKAVDFADVSIYKLPESKKLGACLNYAISRAKYSYVAKFDDDDYYAPNYIPEAMNLFLSSDADVVGKRSFFFYFPHLSTLLLRKSKTPPYSRCKKIAGATIMFHKRVFRRVQFATHVRQGSDVRFVSACLKNGYKLYTTSPYNFAAFRRTNRQSHTWKVSERSLFAGKNTSSIRTNNFKSYVKRPLRNTLKTISKELLPASFNLKEM
ncbi:glycosyltransferase family 2 protein [Paenibacillus prosopidis]|uniref:Glycosyl transferase family 2 n=1 Tax=Paenibacillus prosopidis TaxID=630520 RepID=A0A368VXC8_9BACL|nr:glycosyltransferase [Paenibacillus prosopidis]RCW45442.1 glycosyl transferase family 2 [Paenibacillus prosopidis]